jgi:hypothetical protein
VVKFTSLDDEKTIYLKDYATSATSNPLTAMMKNSANSEVSQQGLSSLLQGCATYLPLRFW